jgi:hypothetical protein
LPGRKIIPERIREDRASYYKALEAADKAWENGNLDFSLMEEYIANLMQEQLLDEGLPPESGTAPQQ